MTRKKIDKIPHCSGGRNTSILSLKENQIIPPYSVDWKSKVVRLREIFFPFFPGDNVLHFTDHSLDLRPKKHDLSNLHVDSKSLS